MTRLAESRAWLQQVLESRGYAVTVEQHPESELLGHFWARRLSSRGHSLVRSWAREAWRKYPERLVAREPAVEVCATTVDS